MTVTAQVKRLAAAGRVDGWTLVRLAATAVLRHRPTGALEVVATADLPLFISLLRSHDGEALDVRCDAGASIELDWAQLGKDWHGAFLDFACVEVLLERDRVDLIVSVGSTRVFSSVDVIDFESTDAAVCCAKRRAASLICGLFLGETNIWRC